MHGFSAQNLNLHANSQGIITGLSLQTNFMKVINFGELHSESKVANMVEPDETQLEKIVTTVGADEDIIFLCKVEFFYRGGKRV